MAEEPQSLLDSPATAEMLFPTAVAAGLAVAPLALGLPTPERRADTCLDVQIFLARGSSEPYPGLQISVVDVICAGLDSCVPGRHPPRLLCLGCAGGEQRDGPDQGVRGCLS